MSKKSIIWIGMFLGGIAGGYVPLLWGESSFSMSGVFFNAIGAIAGIYFGYRISE